MVSTQVRKRTRARPSERVARPRRRVLQRAASALAGLCLCAAAVYVQANEMSYEQKGSNLTSRGVLGETVETTRFKIKVNSVTAAKAVDTQDYGGKVTKVQTSHLFLIVEVIATAAREPLRFGLSGSVLVTSDGKRYTATDKVDSSLTFFHKWVQPELQSSGKLIFEVPEKAVPGASVVIVSPGGGIITDSFAPEAEIDLGLTGPAAARLIAEAEDYHPLAGRK